jgi:GNAT superfamily N-acetyltransferase
MAVTLAEEKTRDIRAEVEPLLWAHWRELGRHKDVMVLDPDWPTILQHERNGHWRSFTVRSTGRLVGYAAFIVRRSLHYAQVVAVCDVLYLAPEHRRGWVAGRLLAHADAALRDSGVFVVYQRMKVAQPFGVLLERLGYAHIEETFERRLG